MLNKNNIKRDIIEAMNITKKGLIEADIRAGPTTLEQAKQYMAVGYYRQRFDVEPIIA